ncbi:DNA replication complex GINS family protein [Candidatus Woesearchaeota archaeon]|nr:DNA replication complex GINS family protein [Candidatus Woesearchaeota archaeon]
MEIKITLETLYDILRNEKMREELQLLNETFFVDVHSYLKEKQTLLDSKQGNFDLFVEGEKEKLDMELKSIRKMIKEIYERREKKMLDMAINKSRTQSDIIDTSSLLAEEKKFFAEAVAVLDSYRKGILYALWRGELPLVVPGAISESTIVVKTEPVKESSMLKKELSSEEAITRLTVKFLQPVPRFVAEDLNEYGPYEAGEAAEVPAKAANILIERKQGEVVGVGIV